MIGRWPSKVRSGPSLLTALVDVKSTVLSSSMTADPAVEKPFSACSCRGRTQGGGGWHSWKEWGQWWDSGKVFEVSQGGILGIFYEGGPKIVTTFAVKHKIYTLRFTHKRSSVYRNNQKWAKIFYHLCRTTYLLLKPALDFLDAHFSMVLSLPNKHKHSQINAILIFI